MRLFQPECQKELGKFLKARRQENGYTQKEVSKKLKLDSPQFISNIERGHCGPPLPILKKMIDIYGIDPKDVIELVLSEERKFLAKQFKIS